MWFDVDVSLRPCLVHAPCKSICTAAYDKKLAASHETATDQNTPNGFSTLHTGSPATVPICACCHAIGYEAMLSGTSMHTPLGISHTKGRTANGALIGADCHSF